MKQQHAMRFYGESYAIATTAVLPSCQQFIECRVRSTVIKHTARHVAFWPQPVGSLPLAQNACSYIQVCGGPGEFLFGRTSATIPHAPV